MEQTLARIPAIYRDNASTIWIHYITIHSSNVLPHNATRLSRNIAGVRKRFPHDPTADCVLVGLG